MNKLYTALRLIRLLNERKKINSKIVAEELEVSLRTAQRYLQEIQTLPGVIYDEKDKSYKLIENYQFHNTFLSQTELSYINALFNFISKDLNDKASKYIHELKKKIFHLNTLSSNIILLQTERINFSDISNKIEKLEQTIINNKKIKFIYKRYEKEYIINPYKILISEGFWYLVGEHENVLKKFLIDQIENIEILHENFSHKKNIDNLINNLPTIWFSDEEPIEIIIEVDKLVSDYFKRKKCLTGQEIIKESDKGLTIKFFVFTEDDFIFQIIRWAPYIKVMSPENYKKALKKYLVESLNKISGDKN